MRPPALFQTLTAAALALSVAAGPAVAEPAHAMISVGGDALSETIRADTAVRAQIILATDRGSYVDPRHLSREAALTREIRRLQTALAAEQSARAEAQETLATRERANRRLRSRLDAMPGSLTEAEALVRRQNREITSLRNALRRTQADAASAGARAATLRDRLDNRQDRTATVRARSSNLQATVEDLRQKNASLRQRNRRLEDELNQARVRISELQRRVHRIGPHRHLSGAWVPSNHRHPRQGYGHTH